MIADALLILALGAVPTTPPARLEVVLTGGRTLRGSVATWDGDQLVVTTAEGPVKVAGSDVLEVRELPAAKPGTAPASTRTAPRVESRARPAPSPPAAAIPSDAADAASEASVLEALRRAQSGDVGTNERVLRDALVEHPGQPLLLLALGRTLVTSGRFVEAIAPLRAAGDGLAEEPRRARDLALAEALSRLDRPDEALAALATTPDDTPGVVAATREALQRDLDVRGERVLHESDHFTFQAPFGVHSAALEPLTRGVEAVYDELSAVFGAAPNEKVIVILYPGGEFWESMEVGSAVGGLYDGKVRVPVERIDPPTRSLSSVLRHEVAHAFVDALSAGRADRGWHEGIAEHFEGDSITAIERSLADRYRRSPSEWPPELDHPTAHSRVNYFVRRHGVDKLREFLVGLARGAGEDQALHAAIGMDAAELNAEWGRALAARPR